MTDTTTDQAIATSAVKKTPEVPIGPATVTLGGLAVVDWIAAIGLDAADKAHIGGLPTWALMLIGFGQILVAGIGRYWQAAAPNRGAVTEGDLIAAAVDGHSTVEQPYLGD